MWRVSFFYSSSVKKSFTELNSEDGISACESQYSDLLFLNLVWEKATGANWPTPTPQGRIRGLMLKTKPNKTKAHAPGIF